MSEPRTPEEVFAHHGQVLGAGDIEGIVSDYSDDAIFISPDGILRGKDGIRKAFVKLVGDVPDAQWELKTVFADDILFLEWSAESAHTTRRGRHRHVRLPRRPDPRPDGAVHAAAQGLSPDSGQAGSPAHTDERRSLRPRTMSSIVR